LVGYTNAGKSSLFNRLTGANVMAKDMLFATLDPTMRAIKLPSGRQIILSDTVGFISELPTQLVAAFRATLEEVLDADLIVHVRDITHPETEEQAEDVREILETLGITRAAHEAMIDVWNKIDQAEPEQKQALLAITERDDAIVATSAISGEGMDKLCDLIDLSLVEPSVTEMLQLEFAEGRTRAWLFDQNVVDTENQTGVGFDLTVTWTKKQSDQFLLL
jgi:GTP-binding protein HflX